MVDTIDELGRVLDAARPRALRACTKLLGSYDDAEEVVAAAIVAALQAVAGGETIDNPAAWLVGTARYKAVDLVRGRERERSRLAEYHRRQYGAAEDLTIRVDDEAEADWLRRQTQQLPVGTQMVFARLESGDTITEAADHLAMTKRAAESHLLRGRQKLLAWWSATLGILSGLGIRIRRTVVLTPTAAAGVSLMLLTLPIISDAPERDDAYGGTLAERPDIARMITLEHTHRTRPQPSPTAARHVRPERPERNMPTPVPTKTTLAAASVPGAKSELYTADRGGPDDPIAFTVWCLEHFEAPQV